MVTFLPMTATPASVILLVKRTGYVRLLAIITAISCVSATLAHAESTQWHFATVATTLTCTEDSRSPPRASLKLLKADALLALVETHGNPECLPLFLHLPRFRSNIPTAIN